MKILHYPIIHYLSLRAFYEIYLNPIFWNKMTLICDEIVHMWFWFIPRFRRGNESVRSRFIDQYVYIKGNSFFFLPFSWLVGSTWILITSMEVFAQSNNRQSRHKSSVQGITLVQNFLLVQRNFKGVDVTQKN